MFFKSKKQNDYDNLVNDYNGLIDDYNELKQAYTEEKEKSERLAIEYRKATEQLDKWTKNQHGKKTKINKSMIAEAVELRSQGYSNVQIGRELSVSEGTVRNIFKRLE